MLINYLIIMAITYEGSTDRLEFMEQAYTPIGAWDRAYKIMDNLIDNFEGKATVSIIGVFEEV